MIIHVINGSSDPVHDVWAWTIPMPRRAVSRGGKRTDLGVVGVGHWETLMPGEHVKSSTNQAAPMQAWLSFTDVRRSSWFRGNHGEVEQCANGAIGAMPNFIRKI